jgi:glycosyltransferase involved in cell wall biosynthesis
MPPKVSVIIPTQRRPLGLATAVRSLARQTGVDLSSLEVVIVDNDAVETARPLVAELSQSLPALEFIYVHEAVPGVASARNAGLSQASGEWIAFLDDDEEATETWLSALMSAAERFEADVVFGPVVGRAPEGAPHRAYLESFFSRQGPNDDALLERYYGCGNSLLRRGALPDPNAPFDIAFDRTGGEDDALFSEMRQHGRRFAWAAGAAVFEDPAPDRLCLRYVIPRAFSHGQGATALRAVYGSAWLVLWSLATGAAQAVVFGVLAVAAFTIAAPRRAFLLDRAARGLGKVFWSRTFQVAFYGLTASEADRDARPAVLQALMGVSAAGTSPKGKGGAPDARDLGRRKRRRRCNMQPNCPDKAPKLEAPRLALPRRQAMAPAPEEAAAGPKSSLHRREERL